MHYLKPNTFKEISQETTVENYNFSEVSSLGLARVVSIGGKDTFKVEKTDRLLIIDEGFAEVELAGKEYTLRDGNVLEIPAGEELQIQGFYKAKMISAK